MAILMQETHLASGQSERPPHGPSVRLTMGAKIARPSGGSDFDQMKAIKLNILRTSRLVLENYYSYKNLMH